MVTGFRIGGAGLIRNGKVAKRWGVWPKALSVSTKSQRRAMRRARLNRVEGRAGA